MEQTENINTLLQEIDWLEQVINQVIKSYLLQDGHEKHGLDIDLPNLTDNNSAYADVVKQWSLNSFDRLALALTMAPHLKPEVLDLFLGKNQMYDRGFTEFGGVIDKDHRGFLPTGQTLAFLITSGNPEYRLQLMNVLGKESELIKNQVLVLSETESYIPDLNGVLSLSDRWMHYFLTGEKLKREFSTSFPAQKISTSLEWDELVLSDTVMDQVLEINAWINNGKTLMEDWGLEKMIKPGYRALFYGPLGTGKTLTATLLGKSSGREVYRVDLSMIVSKYIGETEKNLARIFDVAAHQDWILFFDEADALFGKRTDVNSSNDRHANQQTAYLLQRIEDFSGTVILASNLRADMDEAFTRRFQAIIHFSMPGKDARYQLWQKAFSGKCTLSPEIDLNNIAENYELTGGSITNVLRFCALAAIRRDDNVVTKQELMNGIRNEFKKENKTIA